MGRSPPCQVSLQEEEVKADRQRGGALCGHGEQTASGGTSPANMDPQAWAEGTLLLSKWLPVSLVTATPADCQP